MMTKELKVGPPKNPESNHYAYLCAHLEHVRASNSASKAMKEKQQYARAFVAFLKMNGPTEFIMNDGCIYTVWMEGDSAGDIRMRQDSPADKPEVDDGKS
jgi:hypothetical protein